MVDKIVYQIFPKEIFTTGYYIKGNKGDPKKIEYAEKLFRNCERIDVQPLSSGSRGFIITLDNNFSMCFFQDHDHFVYDGFETGEYDNGDVTVFDNLKQG